MREAVLREVKVGGVTGGLVAIMALRLVVLLAFLLVLAYVLPGDNVAFFALMALAFIVTIPYSLWLRDRSKLSRVVHLQFVVDLVVVTGLVYFTGGIQSDLSLLYPLVILSAGLVTSPRRAIEITCLCVLVYLILGALSTQRVLVAFGEPQPPPGWIALLQSMGLRVLVFAIFGAVSVYVARRCSFLDRRAAQYREVAELVFRHLPAGLVLLDEGNRIRFANEWAARILGQSPEELRGVLFETYPGSSARRPGLAEALGDDERARVFRRADGREVPIHTETADVRVTSDLFGGAPVNAASVLRLVAFSDISRLVELQRQIQEAQRMKTAASLAAQIAHEVRNPVAAISGAAQVLQQLERRSLLGEANSSELLVAERGHLYESIVAESARLNRIIEKFLDYAEFSTDELLRIMRIFESGEELPGDARPVSAAARAS